MLVVGIGLRNRRENVGVEVLPIGQQTPVQGLKKPLFDLLARK